MNTDFNIKNIFDHRLINYWQLFFYNKYLYSFFNSFCKEGKRGFTLKLIYLLLINLKNKTGIPPLLLLKSILINFKQLFKINVKKFKRRKFYSVTHLSYDRQIKQSIQNLTKYFYLINSTNKVESLIKKLTYFFLNLFFKTKNFYGRYLSSLVDNQNKIKDIIDDAEDRILKKNKFKNKFKLKHKKSYIKRLMFNHKARVSKLKEERLNIDSNTSISNEIKSKSKLLLTDKYLIKKRDTDQKKESLKQYKSKNATLNKNNKKFKYKKFSKYKRFYKFNNKGKFNKNKFNKLVKLENTNKINDKNIYNKIDLNHFEQFRLTNIKLNSLYPRRNTIRDKLIYLFIKLDFKRMYYIVESMYFSIFKSNMSIFTFLYKKDNLNEILKEDKKIKNSIDSKVNNNKKNFESEIRFKNFALWFFHVYLGFNEELPKYSNKHALKQVLFHGSLYKKLNEYYSYYYTSTDIYFKNNNSQSNLNITRNNLKLDILTKKKLIKKFKKQFDFLKKLFKERKDKYNNDLKKREKEKKKRKILLNKIKFTLRNFIYYQINKKMNRFIFFFFRRISTLSKTINFKKKRKRFFYRFIPRATINYLN